VLFDLKSLCSDSCTTECSQLIEQVLAYECYEDLLSIIETDLSRSRDQCCSSTDGSPCQKNDYLYLIFIPFLVALIVIVVVIVVIRKRRSSKPSQGSPGERTPLVDHQA